MFVPLLKCKPEEMKEGVGTAVSTVDGDTSQRVRDQLDYRIDVCRVTQEAKIGHL